MSTKTLEKQETFQIGDRVKLPENAAWANYEGVVVGFNKIRGKTYIVVEISYKRKDTGEIKKFKPEFLPERLQKI